ncbi:MAG: hypothetical protein RBR68_16115, partial [Tenuifilaceae bacterium]|nr:hypothetical protein [Tenuifilaceae bacterium]
MKKISIVLIASLILFGCSNSESPDAIREQLSNLKEQQIKLNHDINTLEQKLKATEENNGLN